MAQDRIIDYLAICETKAKYCRCLDTKDWQGFADVFTEDLVLDTTPSGGYEVHGRDEAVGMVRESIGDAVTAHQVHSPEIRIDGDTAEVIWAMQDRVVWDAARAEKMGNLGLTGYGHYHERYVRCSDGQWRITAQQLTRLHMDVHPGTAT